jgi:hypothetical protein
MVVIIIIILLAQILSKIVTNIIWTALTVINDFFYITQQNKKL